MMIKNLIIENLGKLNISELGEVYEFIRTIVLSGKPEIVQNLWARTFGRTPKLPEVEQTELLIKKYSYNTILNTFKAATIRNIKSLQYLIDNLDENGNLKKYEKLNANNQSSVKSRLNYKFDPERFKEREQELKKQYG